MEGSVGKRRFRLTHTHTHTNTHLEVKGSRTIRDLLVHPKDKDTILKKSGVIYKYSCGRVDCGEEYIGESGRTFGERYREHMRSPSPIMDHHNTTGHEVSLDNFTIVGREENNIARNIKEAIFIRVNDPSLNRNIGKFQLRENNYLFSISFVLLHFIFSSVCRRKKNFWF